MRNDELKERFPDLDLEIVSEIIYWNCWSSYEESGGLLIFKAFDSSYQKIDFGYCVMGEPPSYISDIQEISESEVSKEIFEMNELIKINNEG